MTAPHHHDHRVATTGGRQHARRFVLSMLLALAPAAPAATTGKEPVIVVTEQNGTYNILAEFNVPQSSTAALSVLSDYEAIPKFMPDVQSSHVIERGDKRAVIEQEAQARFMMFSKRIQLVLEVREDADAIRFRDRSGKSFIHYEGAWRVVERDGQSEITYDVQVQPNFDVPEFILKRLLKRDAGRMIDNLRAAIAARAAAAKG